MTPATQTPAPRQPTTQKTMVAAINDALAIALERDPAVHIFGEDVGVMGGVFRATDGLQKKYGVERVFDTPLAEAAIVGMGIGMGLAGLRPVAEIQFAGMMLLRRLVKPAMWKRCWINC